AAALPKSFGSTTCMRPARQDRRDDPMDTQLKTGLWLQFGAALDALSDAINLCPDTLWAETSQHMLFWHTAYHTLFWTDLYLAGEADTSQPPAPFDSSELTNGQMPPRVYTKDELRTYLTHCRQKCQTTILNLSDERAAEVMSYGRRKQPFYELQLYN